MSKAHVIFSKIMLVREKVESYDINGFILTPYDAFVAITKITGIQYEAQEVFGIFVLDSRNMLQSSHEIGRGSLNASMAHAREIFKVAILYNAASIVCYHNHPSGDPTPSPEDIRHTQNLLKVSEVLGIGIYDHIIIGDRCYMSFREKGLLSLY